MMDRRFVIASVPAALVGAYRLGMPGWLVVPAVSLLTAWFWSFVFARVRKRALDPIWLPAGWLFGLVVPATIAPAYAILALSFGLVFGCHAFGGSGRYLVNPVLLGAVFLATGYPTALGDAVPPNVGADAWFLLACLAGAVYLVAVRAAAWSIMLAGIAGLAVTGAASGELSTTWQLANGQFALLLAFIATDPTTRPRTTAGAWAFGIMFGALTLLLRIAKPEYPEIAWAALLLASLCVPALDQLATLAKRVTGTAEDV